MTSRPGAIFGVNTYSYTQTTSIAECISRLADAGYDTFELMVYPGHLWPADLDSAARRDLRATLERRALRLMTVNMPNVDINIAGASGEMRNYSLGLLGAFLELAADLGAEGLIIGPGKPNPLFPAPKAQLTDHFFRALDVLAPRSAALGPELWVENMPFAFLPDIDSMIEAIEQYGDPRIGVCYDVANGWFIGEDLRHGLMRSRDRLKLVHLSDTGRDIYRHDPVGDGTVPFGEVPPILAEVDYTDKLMLEIISRSPDDDISASAAQLMEGGFARLR